MKEKLLKEMDKSISVKLPNSLLLKARNKSKETGVAISFIVRRAIEEWVKNDNSRTETKKSN